MTLYFRKSRINFYFNLSGAKLKNQMIVTPSIIALNMVKSKMNTLSNLRSFKFEEKRKKVSNFKR